MQNKQNTKAKVIVIAIAILLCLALAVGITGAFYQAQRRATGTVKMDKGIVIDYTGFGKETDGIWIRENETTFRLFSDTDVQPGEKISLESAGIKANASSVDFYARVKLSYEFYNGETKLETLPASFKASDLITTSATFFGADWVKSSDGYHYYGVDTTLSKFTKAAPADFVDLFDTNARFIIEGAGFTGAENGGEGGGYVVDETTSINKIVVYLTLETLQGDADATAEGWKIEKPVVFADATEKLETSVGKVETTENLNVSVGGAAEVPLNAVVFPYDTTITLTFDSNNVEYVTLTYSNGDSETFSETAANTYEVYANSSKGTVTAYTVGLWSDSEYTGFTFKTKNTYIVGDSDMYDYDVDGLVLSGYFGTDTDITIPATARTRARDFKIVITYSSWDEWGDTFEPLLGSLVYPCKIGNQKFNNFDELGDWMGTLEGSSTFMEDYPSPMTITYETLCETTSILYSFKDVKEIGFGAFMDMYGTSSSTINSVTISEGVEVIGDLAFGNNPIATINLPTTINKINRDAFVGSSITTTVGDLGGNWVYATDNRGNPIENGEAVPADVALSSGGRGIKRSA